MNALSQWLTQYLGHIDLSRIETLGLKGLNAVLVLLSALWFSRLLQRIAEHRLGHDNQNDAGVIRTYKSIIRSARAGDVMFPVPQQSTAAARSAP